VGKPYFVMEHVAGRDLLAWAGERRRSPAELARMVCTVCEAIEHAHARGVIHRDLKPGNILVRSQDDRPVVCDFGLAKWRAEIQDITRHTGTGEILGTPSYMPPEQALGKRTLIGPPTDVYALGAVLYHLLTGRPPFQAPKLFQTIAKVVNEPPVPPRQLDPAIPPALEAVVLKALAKEPTARFPTCAALSQAIAAAVA
jgi:eukaryotic-like serine/threonine-protein kinase